MPAVLGGHEPVEASRAVERPDRAAGRHLGAPTPPDDSGDDHPDSQARSPADDTGGRDDT